MSDDPATGEEPVTTPAGEAPAGEKPAGAPAAAPAGEKPAAPEPGSLLTGGKPTEATPEETAGAWPDDWRDKIAAGDKKAAERLKRYGSPGDLWNAYRAAEAKLTAGGKVDPLPEDATEEQVAEYRKNAGVPEKAEGYFESMPDGIVLSDTDRALAETYVESMHAKNVPPDVVHAGLQWYQDLQAKNVEETQKKDDALIAETSAALREEYGPELAARLNGVKGLLDTAPPLADGTTFSQLLDTTRTSDGRLLGDIPEVVKFFSDVAYQINPAGFVAPSDGAGQLESVNEEIKGLEKQMANPKSDYWKDPAKQARYRQLIDASDKMSKS